MILTTADELRFWGLAKPAAGGCWEWQGRKFHDNYGEFVWFEGRRKRSSVAHRIAWQLANGRALAEGMEACHTCDNRACVRPDHLFEGTRSDNERDKVAKGRHFTPFAGHGEASMQARITDVQALKIRELAQNPDVRFEELGALYGLSARAIFDVVSGHTFSHLPWKKAPRRKHRRHARVLT